MENDRVEPTFSGVRTMLRLPHVPEPASWKAGGVAVVGVPFDLAVTNRPGARFGPAAVRDASFMVADLAHYPTGVDHAALGVDTGDVLLDLHHPYSVPGAITARVAEVVAAGCLPLSLGGDHFITLPILRAVAAHHGPVALVHFDAHTDTWEPIATDDPPSGVGAGPADLNHGSMFVHALREGLIDPHRTIQVGIRTFNDDTRDLTIVDAPTVRRIGTEAVAARIRDHVGSGPAYLTFDIDFLDPAYAPGTGTPVAGGFSTGEAQDILAGLGGIDWVGADVVEVSPAYDHGQVTALAGATVAAEWLALVGATRTSTG